MRDHACMENGTVAVTAAIKPDVTKRDRKESDVADLAAAARVLQIEAEAVLALGRGLGGNFVRALDVLSQAGGRVVVTGMGKSGHVGRKIAATLASTGTPALFVHPAEASHGDLGMIAPGDVVLALSNSGSTPELEVIVGYTRRFRIPLVAVTAGAGSALAEAADVLLLLPRADEACPLGLAPTTSTTMMLALGDAIAIALLRRRGFSTSDFQVLHPGGQIGRKLLKVADIMHSGDSLPLVPPTTSIKETVLAMTAKGFGCAGIVDGTGTLIGIITDGDLRRHWSDNSQTAGEVMTRQPKTIRPHALAQEALAMMNLSERPFTALFVVEDGRPVGILNVHDVLRAGVA
jgi:arabinose-5-phosphate isomerase